MMAETSQTTEFACMCIDLVYRFVEAAMTVMGVDRSQVK